MRVALAAALVLVGCSSEPQDCSIGTVEHGYVGSAMLDNCGDLQHGDFSSSGHDG